MLSTCVEDELPSWHAREHMPVVLLWNRNCSTSASAVGQVATQSPREASNRTPTTALFQCFQVASTVSVPCRNVRSGSGSCMTMALRASVCLPQPIGRPRQPLQGSSRRCCVRSGTPANALGSLKPEAAADNAILEQTRTSSHDETREPRLRRDSQRRLLWSTLCFWDNMQRGFSIDKRPAAALDIIIALTLVGPFFP